VVYRAGCVQAAGGHYPLMLSQNDAGIVVEMRQQLEHLERLRGTHDVPELGVLLGRAEISLIRPMVIAGTGLRHQRAAPPLTRIEALDPVTAKQPGSSSGGVAEGQAGVSVDWVEGLQDSARSAISRLRRPFIVASSSDAAAHRVIAAMRPSRRVATMGCQLWSWRRIQSTVTALCGDSASVMPARGGLRCAIVPDSGGASTCSASAGESSTATS
jgi:hypothetical protein